MFSIRTFRKSVFRLIVVLFMILLTIPASTCCKSENPYPLSVPGPFGTSYCQIRAVDSNRGNRPVNITIWYPAAKPKKIEGNMPKENAEPDKGNIPWPLLLSSTKMAKIFAPLVVPYGFAWASIDNIDYWMSYNEQIIHQPMDILFALDQIATNPPESLSGLINTDMAGTLGYSFDGFNSLALSGARIDPAYYLAQCANPSQIASELQPGVKYGGYCALADRWDWFASVAGAKITETSDGLWQPVTDPRIRAVMPMACDGWLLFGERGLAAVDRPVLMIVASRDELFGEANLIFSHLGTNDRRFIVFKDLDHTMIYDEQQVSRIAHFAIAFFGTTLQGNKDYPRYLTEEFVKKHAELDWIFSNVT